MSGIARRVPVTTVGGFLGAGKTTLVNHLLRHSKGRRIVVFVNDFGAIDIDRDLIDTIEEDRVSLRNGCVCCSLNADLVSGVAQFARAPTPPDSIVIEASGVSDPRSLDASLATLESAGMIRLDLQLYLVDASLYGALDYPDRELILDHAGASDLVLVNKTDLATDAERRALSGDLDEAAPFSPILETRRCAVDPAVLVGPSLSIRQSARERDAGSPNAPAHSFRTWSFETDRRFFRDRFATVLSELPRYCVRAKGFVGFAGTPGSTHLVNLVGTRADIEACPVALRESVSRLVFIGRSERFDEEQVATLVMGALAGDRRPETMTRWSDRAGPSR